MLLMVELDMCCYNKANLWHLVHMDSPRLKKYAQIEKEMLAIVCGYEKFDQYVYGHKVTVENNHKPLSEYISKTHSHSTQEITTDAPSTTKV